jgi:signal transduction histidine kinase
VIVAVEAMDARSLARTLRSGASDVVYRDELDEIPGTFERALLCARESRLTRLLMDHSHNALTRAREQLELVSRHGPVLVWTLDRSGRIVTIEGAALGALNIDEVASRGRDAPDVLGAMPFSVAELSARNEPVTFEFELGERVFEATVRRLQGRVSAPEVCMGVAVDVTEQRRLERQLAVAQRFETLGRLAGGIAHDFRNLITLVDGHAELVLDDLEPDSPLCRDIRAIRDAAARAERLVAQLLRFRHRGSGDRRSLHLDRLLRDFETSVGRMLGKRITLEVCCSNSLPPIVADPTSLEQLLLNLLVNARDAMPSGGRARIEAEPGEVRGRPSVVLRVVDAGAGMDEDTKRRLFEPLF